MLGDGARGGLYVAEISRTVFFRRRADGEKNDEGLLDCRFQVGRKLQTTRLRVLGD
jgi:hypothetical protein